MSSIKDCHIWAYSQSGCGWKSDSMCCFFWLYNCLHESNQTYQLELSPVSAGNLSLSEHTSLTHLFGQLFLLERNHASIPRFLELKEMYGFRTRICEDNQKMCLVLFMLLIEMKWKSIFGDSFEEIFQIPASYILFSIFAAFLSSK